jgi:uncharacterized protein (TIGR02231 family)
MKHPILSSTTLALCFVSLSHVCLAVDIQATAAITKVTVSQGSADVTRTGLVAVPAGEHNLIIGGLPGQLDLSRLVISLANDDVRLGNLRVRREDQQNLTGESQQQLQDQLDELSYQRGRIDDTVQSANMQIQLLDSLSSGSLGTLESTFSSNSITEMLSVVSSSSNTARQTIRDAQRRGSRLDIEIEQLRRRLAEFASRNRFSQVAVATVVLPTARDLEFTITYPANGARWTWLYEARLDTDSSFLELGRKVAVNQTTGENWQNVALTITTAHPSSSISPPEIDSLLVSLDPPRQQPQESRRLSSEAMMRTEAGASEDIMVAAYLKSSVDIDSTAYLVDYQIPGDVTINSGGEQQIFPIDERRIDTNLVVRVMPEQDRAAYLEAHFILDDDVPVQPGTMQFYRDGSFIGSQRIAGFLPQEEVSLAFGQDERVRVEVLPDEEGSDGGGTFRRGAVDNRRQRFMITSFHDAPKLIEVVARIPVSQNDDIEVEIDADATPADQVDLDDKTGLILWRRLSTGTVPIEIKHYYSIRYPRDRQLFYRN